MAIIPTFWHFFANDKCHLIFVTKIIRHPMNQLYLVA